MSAASDIARSHVAAFNQAVAGGDFADFLARFDDAAIIRFENVPSAGALEFAGRPAYTAAYAQQPPDDQIDIAGQPGEDRGAVVIRSPGGATAPGGRCGLTARMAGSCA